MKYFFLLSLFFSQLVNAQQTIFEKSSGTQTATYPEVISYYQKLARQSPLLQIKEMGQTDAGFPLHLITISSQINFNPNLWHQQKKIIILINNGIHPGEPDGIDASMMLARDIINKKIILPGNVALGIIPVYNIGGSLNRNSFSRVNQNGPEEYGFRGNAQNLDLNRDFTKADSKNAASFAGIFHYLNPDLFIDNHVSDGADFQHTITLLSTQYDKLGPVLGPWLKNRFEPEIYAGMKKKNWDLIPYVDFENTDMKQGMTMFYEPPRYSSGYAALFGTPGFMPETHMLKPYQQRVQSTYDLMSVFIAKASGIAAELILKRAENLQQLLNQKNFTLSWKPTKENFSMVTFKGYMPDTAISEATGLSKMFYNHQKPFTAEIPFYNSFVPDLQVQSPEAYLIPQGWYEVIERMKANGVKMERLAKDTQLEINYYKISSYKSYPTPYEKHHLNYGVEVEKIKDLQQFKKGDYLINTRQPSKRYIIEMLEPQGPDSFFSWNFFDAILQQKEGYSDYRWEDLAAAWLKKDIKLQQKLAEMKAADAEFAKSSRKILNFIYKNSPYYEKAHLRYPVYRIEEK